MYGGMNLPHLHTENQVWFKIGTGNSTSVVLWPVGKLLCCGKFLLCCESFVLCSDKFMLCCEVFVCCVVLWKTLLCCEKFLLCCEIFCVEVWQIHATV